MSTTLEEFLWNALQEQPKRDSGARQTNLLMKYECYFSHCSRGGNTKLRYIEFFSVETLLF